MKEIAEWTWSKQWDKPYIFFATTNGTLLNDHMKEWFTLNKERIVLCLSYDGTEQMQNSNRSHSSSLIDFDFFHHTWPNQSIKMTISQNSIKNLAEGIIHLTELGVKINANVAYENEEWKVENIDEYASQLAKLIDYYSENPALNRVSILNLNVRNLFKSQNIKQHKYCGAGEAFDVTDVDGKQYPCHMLSPLVLIRSRLKRLNELDIYEQKNFADQRCSKCSFKNICPTCAGMNYNITGNTQLRDKTHCRIFILDVMSNVKLQTKLLNTKILAKQELSREEKETAVTIKEISKLLNSNFRRNS